jgi:aminopeptidase
VLTDIQLERYAKVLIWALEKARIEMGGHEYVPGENIALPHDALAAPLAEKIYRMLLRRGVNVLAEVLPSPAMSRIFYEEANDAQLQFLGPWSEVRAENLHGSIFLRAPSSLTHLKDIDPSRTSMRDKAYKPILKIRKGRENSGEFAWTLCDMPTQARADQAKMTLSEYSEQIALSCYLDDEDPIASWQRTMAGISKVKDWLTGLDIDFVHVVSEDGETDLRVWIGPERKWLGGGGRNIPSFEVFVSPEAGRAEGRYHASEMSFREGRYVRNARLVFQGGEVIEATADEEQEYLRARVALDEGSKMLGEFSLTDRRHSRITKFMASTLFDENVGGANGNCHIAIGRGFNDSYSGSEPMDEELAKKLKINDSTEHWDLITTTPRVVTAHLKDGREIVIYENGQFTIEV